MRVLLIEDDEDICKAVTYAMIKEGYEIDVCNEGDDGLRAIRERAYDLILLDRMLPRMNGMDILRTARKEDIQTPVLMVTALGESGDLIEGLDNGADDYIIKPFIMEELLARVRATLRRPRALEARTELRCGSTVLYPNRLALHNGDEEISLTKRECALLEIFMKNIGVTLHRATLMTHVWGKDAAVEGSVLDNYMTFLRRRLKSVSSPVTINTIRGVGFVMESETA